MCKPRCAVMSEKALSFYLWKRINLYLSQLLFGQLSVGELSCYPFEVNEETNNLGFRPGPIQTSLYSHRSKLDA